MCLSIYIHNMYIWIYVSTYSQVCFNTPAPRISRTYLQEGLGLKPPPPPHLQARVGLSPQNIPLQKKKIVKISIFFKEVFILRKFWLFEEKFPIFSLKIDYSRETFDFFHQIGGIFGKKMSTNLGAFPLFERLHALPNHEQYCVFFPRAPKARGNFLS